MKAIDTNVLVYARIESSPHHKRALSILEGLAEGEDVWAIPWPCIYEYLRVVTHPRIYHPPISAKEAEEDIMKLVQSPALVLLSETTFHATVLEGVLRQSGASGNLIHDAHIAAVCIEHGVKEIITGDRDFSRFAGVRTSNPFS